MAHQTIYLVNGVDEDHLSAVMMEMSARGAPTVRVVDCGDYLMAIEGSHRLTAAARLGLVPDLDIIEQDDIVDTASLDADCLDEDSYTAGELAAALYDGRNPTLTITSDGTLEA